MIGRLRRLQRTLRHRITPAAATFPSPYRALAVRRGDGAADQAVQQRRRLTLLFALLFLTSLLGSVLAVRIIRDLTDDEGVVAQAHGILDQTAAVQADLDDVEIDVRTYLLTGDATYRTAYAAERTVMVAGDAQLLAATANDAVQRGRVARLTPLIAQRLTQLQRASDLRAQQHTADAVAALSSATSTRTETSIDALFAQIDAAADHGIADRLRAANDSLVEGQRILIASTIANILLLAALFALIWHTFAAHERHLRAERAARAQVEATLALRDQFLSLASHELRTPLTILLHSVELLDRRVARTVEVDERLREILATIHRQLARLQMLIATMLDVSRIERGQLTIAQKPLDLTDLVRTVVDEMRPTLERHTTELTTPPGPIFVSGDAERLSEVLLNLLDNAGKYSPGGGTIWVEVRPASDWVEVAVTDPGIGIPADAIPHLFERFYRAPPVRSEHIGGMGVGLCIVGEIVALHGGEVAVTSTEGVGSTFTVRLPTIAPEGSEPDAGRAEEHTQGPQARVSEGA
jgi:signal transduction histidine kinase